MHTKLKTQGIDVKIELTPELLQQKLHGNRVQLSQVFMNLFSNSYDAILKKDSKWVKLEASITDQTIEIKFSDCGYGIPKSVASHIFDPFYTTKEVGKGTGLGLSISKNIITKHGGSIALDQSAPHTTFLISIPLAQKMELAS